MSSTIEIEVTYLAARVPEDLAGCICKELEDIYFPATAEHAKVRIRRSDKVYEFTKKTPLDQNDAGRQKEENVALTGDEFAALAKGDGRRLVKTRYYLPYDSLIAEVDIFQGELAGLVIIEFEFKSPEAKEAFTMPNFCLADITQDAYFAGGLLAGRTYAEVAPELARYHYQPLHFRTAGPQTAATAA